MALSIGTLVGYLKLDDTAFEKGLKAGQKKFSDAGKYFKTHADTIARTSGRALAVGLTAGAAAAYKMTQDAADLAETMNKAKVIFGDNYAAVNKWSAGAATSMGLSKKAALDAAAGFGDMFTQIGFGGDQAAKMSRKVVQMSADLGSFNNLPTEDVAQRISAAFRGEYDSLQALIPNINAARVQSKALAMTGKTNADALTAQEKAAATLAIVNHDGARAAGDFARTSGSLANQQKIAAAKAEDLQAKLGQKLIPVMLKLVTAGGKVLNWIDKNQRLVTILVGVIGGLTAGIWLASTAITAWSTITKVASGVAKAFTIVQKGLNLALRMNPIGIVITALVALGAGLVLAYKKSETFRRIVNAAWGAIKHVALTVVHWFTEKFVPFFTETIPGAFRKLIGWVREHWKVILSIVTGPIGAATIFIWTHWDKIKGYFRKAKDWVVGAFKAAWNGVKAVVTAPIELARDVIRRVWDQVKDKFSGVKDWVFGFFKRAWDGIKTLITDPVQAAKNLLHNLLGASGPFRGIFSRAVDAVGRIWEGLKRLAAKPVNFIIGTVYNDGIRRAINLIPGVEDLPKASKISFATGGSTGPGGKYQPAGIVHADEHVWTKEEVRAAGGHGVLEAMRRSVLRGYATGGRVWPVPGHDTGTYPGHDGVDINRGSGWDDYGDPIRAAADGIISYVGWGRGYGQAIFERGPYGELVYGHTSAALARAGQRVSAGTLIGRVGSTGNSSAPHLHFGFPGGTTAQALAFLSGASVSGGGSAGGGWWDVLGKAWDAVTTMPGKFGEWGSLLKGGMGSLWGTIKDQVTRLASAGVEEGSKMGIFGLAGQAAAHLGLFDMGGLASNAGLMVKGPQPERVLSPRQTEAFERAMDRGFGGEAVFHLYDSDGALLGTMRGVADNQIASHERSAKIHAGSGRQAL